MEYCLGPRHDSTVLLEGPLLSFIVEIDNLGLLCMYLFFPIPSDLSLAGGLGPDQREHIGAAFFVFQHVQECMEVVSRTIHHLRSSLKYLPVRGPHAASAIP